MDAQPTTTTAAVNLVKERQDHDQQAATTAEATISPPQEPVLSTGAPPPAASMSTNDAQDSQAQETLDTLVMPSPAVPALVRTETAEPIGAASDLPTPMLGRLSTDASHASGPVIIINLLLTSTGTRHPYRIDEKYLNKRNVSAENENGEFDPFVISVYTLKELIWRDWREEWEPRPSSPAAIRLIHFGRFLEDKLPLKDCRFSDSAPNVVHLSVKPQELLEEEETTKGSKGKGSGRLGSRIDSDGNEPTAGCRCVIQ